MINPMDIPALRSGMAKQPLNPVEKPELMELFVDIDESRAAFEQFQRDFADPRWLDHGAIVVAAGREQTGKTALLYRCARWLTQHLGAPGQQVKVLDCTRVELTAVTSIDARMQEVCTYLKDELFSAGIVIDERLLAAESPRSLIPRLSKAVTPDVVLVIVLPSSDDLVAEITTYAGLVPKRVMLLTETPYLENPDDARVLVERSRAVSSVLGLGLLKGADGDLFYHKRRLLHPDDADVPAPADGTLERIIKARDTTIGDLQKLIWEVYDDLRRRNDAVPEVTYDHITDYYFRVAHGGRK
ncbi:hypothetical protein [Paractinoplanes maris]|uniref:hypothetical protein n=1 Tax=Paractinoplanes maris TaxID=1734446 RepID=UPI0020228FB2|nr:hypothetical protein [Actinoplanes maris]